MKLIDTCEAAHIVERVFCDDCYYNGVRCSTCPIDGVIELIDNTKAVDAVPVVHGHWVESTNYMIEKCSKCGYSKAGDWQMNFCPNCGAKMAGKDSEKNG